MKNFKVDFIINNLRITIVLLFVLFAYSCIEKSQDIIPNHKIEDLINFNKTKQQYEPVYYVSTLVFDFFYLGSVNCMAQPTNCLQEIVVTSESKSKNASINDEKLQLYKEFKLLYNENSTSIFFQNNDWRILFPGLTVFCAKEMANGNLKFIKKATSSVSQDEIYLIVEKNVDVKNWTRNDVIGAVQISFKL